MSKFEFDEIRKISGKKRKETTNLPAVELEDEIIFFFIFILLSFVKRDF